MEGIATSPVHNRCHVVPNAEVLEGLSDKDGQVVVLEWGVTEWRNWIFSGSRDSSAKLQDPTMTDLRRRSHNDACVGWFACELLSHDREFQKRGIDVANPNFSDPEVRFLVAYRLTLFQVDQYRLVTNLARGWRQSAMRNPDSRKRALWLSENKKREAQLQKAEATRNVARGNLACPKDRVESLMPILYRHEFWSFGRSYGLRAVYSMVRILPLAFSQHKVTGTRWLYSTLQMKQPKREKISSTWLELHSPRKGLTITA